MRASPATFADGDYAGPKLEKALASIGRWTIEIVKRSDAAQGPQTAATPLVSNEPSPGSTATVGVKKTSWPPLQGRKHGT
jgi:hypothetical protein